MDHSLEVPQCERPPVHPDVDNSPIGAFSDAGKWRWSFCEQENVHFDPWDSPLLQTSLLPSVASQGSSYYSSSIFLDLAAICCRSYVAWTGCMSLPHLLSLKRLIDCSGTALIAGGSTAVILGITWGGVQAPWSSGQVIAPLVVGAVAIVAFFVYELTLAKNPLVRAPGPSHFCH